MGNKIKTEADRKATPRPPAPVGVAFTDGPRPEGQPGAWLAHAQQEEPRQAPEKGRLSPAFGCAAHAASDRIAPAARPCRGRTAAAIVARLGVRDADLAQFTVFRRAYDARKKTAIQLIYTVDCEVAGEAAVLARLAGGRACAAGARHELPIHCPCASGLLWRWAPAPLGRRFRPLRPVRSLDPGPDGPGADRARARQGGARAHAGHLGPVAPRCAGPRVQRAVRRGWRRHVFGRQAVEPDHRSAAPDAQGADRVRQGRCARRDPVRQQAAHRHLPAGRHGREDACRDRVAGRRDPLPAARGRPADRRRHGAWRAARLGRGTACRPCRAGARPQCARHLRDAAPPRRVHAGQAVLGRLPHRAPAGPDRPCAFRRRARATRCSARPTTSWCTTPATAARSTASACAPAARWWRPHRSPNAWSPTA